MQEISDPISRPSAAVRRVMVLRCPYFGAARFKKGVTRGLDPRAHPLRKTSRREVRRWIAGPARGAIDTEFERAAAAGLHTGRVAAMDDPQDVAASVGADTAALEPI